MITPAPTETNQKSEAIDYINEFDRLVGSWDIVEYSTPWWARCIITVDQLNFQCKKLNDDGKYYMSGEHSIRFFWFFHDSGDGKGDATVDKTSGRMDLTLTASSGQVSAMMQSEGNGKFSTVSRGKAGTIVMEESGTKAIYQRGSIRVVMQKLKQKDA